MEKKDFLERVATTGYNVGFGAKKHFSTFDIIDQAPGIISFSSMAVGILALFWEPLSSKVLSATFIILGIAGLYIKFFDRDKDAYDEAGKALTRDFHKLKDLYYRAKATEDIDAQDLPSEFQEIEDRLYEHSISRQILFSGWLAHMKFFGEAEIGWVEEQKNFHLLRDKVPFSLRMLFILALVVVGVGFGSGYACEQFCGPPL